MLAKVATSVRRRFGLRASKAGWAVSPMTRPSAPGAIIIHAGTALDAYGNVLVDLSTS